MSKFNLFQKPVEKASLEDWAKIAADVAKVAIIAVPAIIYNNDPIYEKLIQIGFLFIGIYAALQSGRIIRRYQLKQENVQ